MTCVAFGGCRVGAPKARAEAEGRRSRRGRSPQEAVQADALQMAKGCLFTGSRQLERS